MLPVKSNLLPTSLSRFFDDDWGGWLDWTNRNATYENGILSLTLPKKEEAKEKPARMIAIS